MAVAIETSFLQLLDDYGEPLGTSATVTVYDAGTTNLRNIYSNPALSTLADNPITLDSAGRHGMRYTAPTAYKLLIQWPGGSLIRDNIDPGVPIGSGALAIANGGTGATTANAARAAIGAASTDEMSDLAADVAALEGSITGTDKISIPKGTTAQRPVAPETGDIRYNTTTSEYENYLSSGWDNAMFETSNEASASDIAAETAGANYIRPDRAKYAPSAISAWGKITYSGGTPSLASRYNLSATVTDNGSGDVTVTFTNPMADAHYVVSGTPYSTNTRLVRVHTASTTTLRLQMVNESGTGQDEPFAFMVIGPLA